MRWSASSEPRLLVAPPSMMAFPSLMICSKAIKLMSSVAWAASACRPAMLAHPLLPDPQWQSRRRRRQGSRPARSALGCPASAGQSFRRCGPPHLKHFTGGRPCPGVPFDEAPFPPPLPVKKLRFRLIMAWLFSCVSKCSPCVGGCCVGLLGLGFQGLVSKVVRGIFPCHVIPPQGRRHPQPTLPPPRQRTWLSLGFRPASEAPHLARSVFKDSFTRSVRN